MGLLSWFSTTASKSTAAALVQSALEPLVNGGLFEVNPATLANRVVEGAFNRVPNLANANYNRHVLAVATLTMVPALPAFSEDEKEASKHALGFLLKYVLELQMSNSVALTMSEQGLLERAQQTYLAAMEPSPTINLGPSFEEASTVQLDIDKFARMAERKPIFIEAENIVDCLAAERDYIDKTFEANGPWKLLNQSLVEEDGSVYDKFEIVLSNGVTKTVWFDITYSWKQWS